MRSVKKSVGILLLALLMAVGACGSDELTDEQALNLAKDKYAEEQVTKAKEWGAPLASKGPMYMHIKAAEVLSNDGQKASVQLTIQVRPDLPTTTRVIEVTKPE